MTLYVRALQPISLTVSEDGTGSEFRLDQRVAYKVLPLWVAQLPGFQRLWAANKVQVAKDSAFSSVVSSIPASETELIAPATHNANAKISLVDDDEFPVANSENSYLLAKSSFSTLKSSVFNYLVADKANVANGFAGLDSGGKLPLQLMPSSIFEYKGVWNASTNSPTLVNSTGRTGDLYRVSTAGTQNFGAGNISFEVGDYVIYNSSGVWEKSDTTDAVATVNGYIGNVTLTKSDVGLGNADNTSDVNKPVSSATQSALDTKQPLNTNLTSFAAKAAPTGSVVGTTDVQAITNKDLSSATNTFPTFNQSTTGNAATATKLATARAINGVNFDGTADVTIPASIGFQSYTSTNSTITLTSSSPLVIVFTGTSSYQNVRLPTTNIKAGAKYTIINKATNNVDVYGSDGVFPWSQSMPTASVSTFIATKDSPTAGSDWTAINSTINAGSYTAWGGTAQFNSLRASFIYGTGDTANLPACQFDGAPWGGAGYNYPKLSGVQNGNAVAYSVAGYDSNITLNLVSKGSGTVQANGLEVMTSKLVINTQTGTTYTLVLADAGRLVTLNNSSSITLTVPTNASVAYPVGTRMRLAQLGAGQVTVAGDTGVTVNGTPGLKISAQYGVAELIKVGTDTWLLTGSLSS